MPKARFADLDQTQPPFPSRRSDKSTVARPGRAVVYRSGVHLSGAAVSPTIQAVGK